MITLKNLDSKITSLDQTPIADLKPGKTLTYKSALISVCELHHSTEPGSGENLLAYDIGTRLVKTQNEIELDEADIAFLMKIVKSSQVFLAVVIGRLYYYLKDASESTGVKK